MHLCHSPCSYLISRSLAPTAQPDGKKLSRLDNFPICVSLDLIPSRKFVRPPISVYRPQTPTLAQLHEYEQYLNKSYLINNAFGPTCLCLIVCLFVDA